MCEYCKSGKHICEFSTPRNEKSIYIKNRNELFCIMPYGYMYAKINFCPMCGRKLED